MKIGFLSNQLDIRGTGNALYNYAHYNETILGNESRIYTFATGRHDGIALDNFRKRFGEIHFVSEGAKGLDALYHIKSGYKDGFNTNVPYLVHSVFDNEPHGAVYATISPWMGKRYNLDFVGHIIDISSNSDDFRSALSIPSTAVVFGRHGGLDSFDIPFVWDAIKFLSESRDDVYFLFMNTAKPSISLREDRIFFIPATVNPWSKRQFINTCDAMIHARSRGETFGISIGEFAMAGKPIITYENSRERAHIEELGHFAFLYTDYDSLLKQFNSLIKQPALSWGYGQYTPEKVMKKFEEVFLCGL